LRRKSQKGKSQIPKNYALIVLEPFGIWDFKIWNLPFWNLEFEYLEFVLVGIWNLNFWNLPLEFGICLFGICYLPHEYSPQIKISCRSTYRSVKRHPVYPAAFLFDSQYP
jgi:hypothetical protein